VSDQENFVTRWSRRKRETERAASDDAQSAPPEGAPAPSAATEQNAHAGEPSVPAEESEVDLAKLPPLESITAATDIRAFLAPGVPAALTRAALRRAWAADPAIRDFVGLAENAWDFNAPDSIPGFGSALPAGEAQRLIAEMVRRDDRVSSSAGDAQPVQKTQIIEAQETPTPEPVVEEARIVDATDPPRNEEDPDFVAVQKEEAEDDRRVCSVRQHGGALPH
jgi:uncharacterized protein DUF3306